MIPRIVTQETLTVFLDGKPYTVRKDVANFNQINEAVEQENVSVLKRLIDVANLVQEFSNNEVSVVDGEVFHNGKVLHNAITQRILALVAAGQKWKYMANFLARIEKNPSKTAADELYLFLEHANIPITVDGFFLAYRKVDSDYMSFHENPDKTKNRNMIGDIVTMERRSVDDKRDNVCSEGLHFCSFSYLSQYYGGSGKVVIVKIDPADVVSIPSDYNNAKGRCCKYEVVGEVPEGDTKEFFDNRAVVNDNFSLEVVNDENGSEPGIEVEDEDGEIRKIELNETESRIVNYIDNRGIVTLRQIQSSFSPTNFDFDYLARRCLDLGYCVESENGKYRGCCQVYKS